MARRWLEERMEVISVASAEACDQAPLVACLAMDAPGREGHAAAVRLTRTWPLCRVVAIGSSLCEGRRRSGPSLPGVEEIPWHELPGRLECWLADMQAGRPGGLGLPHTIRREDRLLDGIRSLTAESPDDRRLRRTISIVSSRPDALDGLTVLLASLGRSPLEATVGRPSMATKADVLLWECAESIAPELPWLQVLSAHRPDMDIVVLESFPRGDRTIEAIRCGASCVLGRPTSAEVLLGTLRWLSRRRGIT